MNDSSAELSNRKKMILKAIVDAHIACGEPVGSKFLSQNQQIALSSATIRNELAELTEMGYLIQPHTSAGRIPSEQGYRFYVDSLMQAYSMTANEIRDLNEMLRERTMKLDRIIDRASKLIASLTHYPAIAVCSSPKKQTARCLNLMNLDGNNFLVIVMISESSIKTRHIHSDIFLDQEALQKMQTILNHFMDGKEPDKLTLAEIMEMEEEFGLYRSLVSPIVKSVYEALEEDTQSELEVSGVDHFLEYPEFTEVSRMRDMLGMLSDKENLLSLVESSHDEGVNVYIGSENRADKSGESALIVKNIMVDGKAVGAIGVIGPCRMDYSRVVSTVEMLSKSISDMLEEKKLPNGFHDEIQPENTGEKGK
jgi:heat-inducible transcriptional repressor